MDSTRLLVSKIVYFEGMEYGEKYLKYKERIVFGKQSIPYFKRNLKEYQENEACFVFVNQGQVSVRAPENYFNLNNKTAVLAKCLNYFFETSEKQRQNGDGIEVIAVLLYPSVVEEIFNFDLSLSTFNLPYNIKQVTIDRLLENYKESINILLDNPELADENVIKTKLKEFVLLISKSQNMPSELDFLHGLFNPANVSFKETINFNMYSNLSIEELAKLCHMSLSSFKRKFFEVFKDSPKKFIAKMKVEKAANLLKTSNERISNIAYEVGFDSLATFNRNFFNIYEKSPSLYRMN
jgi:AraC-like DNA-binding protein